MADEIVDATVVDEEGRDGDGNGHNSGPSVAVALRPSDNRPALFRDYEDDGARKLEIATGYANRLSDVLRRQGMTTTIGKGSSAKEHVDIEGWQVAGTFAGVAVRVRARPFCHPVTGDPVITRYHAEVTSYYSKQQGGGVKSVTHYDVDGYDWEGEAEALLPDGTVVGSAESLCSRKEARWAQADDFAIKGMAQTRAASRAYAAALRWVVKLAGYSGTPAEEMPEKSWEKSDDDHPPYGEPMAPNEAGSTAEALAFLLSDAPTEPTSAADVGLAEKVWLQLEKDAGGYMPWIVARVIKVTKAALAAKLKGEAEALPVAGEVISPAQLTRLCVVWANTGAPDAELRRVLKDVAGVESRKDIPRDRYDDVVAAIERLGPTDASKSDVPPDTVGL